MKRWIYWALISFPAWGNGCVEVHAYTHKDFPNQLDKEPKKKNCNRIEYFTECKDLTHESGKDYKIFRWHDEATDCINDSYKNPLCIYVSQMVRIRIRKGCEISWCAKAKAEKVEVRR